VLRKGAELLPVPGGMEGKFVAGAPDDASTAGGPAADPKAGQEARVHRERVLGESAARGHAH